jgi:transcriptional regulator GlxA family with amidase domain
MHISLLVYEEVIQSSVSSVVDILMGANQFLERIGRPPAFKVTLVSEELKNIQIFAPSELLCHKTLRQVGHADLIIAPAFHGRAEEVLRKNETLVKWIRRMNSNGTEIASLCFGSYFLAEAGILNGKHCTSHWTVIDDMRVRYPEAKVLADMVITDQEGVYTSGGAFSSLNLVLYLIEKFIGRETAIWASKMFSIDLDRVSQAHFAVFQGQRQHDDDEILKAQTYIEQHFHLPLSIDDIAGQSNMSKRNFIRRFKIATCNTPLEYLQRVKVESAKKALEKNTQNISSLMYDVGYNDIKTFRNVFKRVTGLTPMEYRRKYCRMETA